MIKLDRLDKIIMSREDIQIESRLKRVLQLHNEENKAFLSANGYVIFVVRKRNRSWEVIERNESKNFIFGVITDEKELQRFMQAEVVIVVFLAELSTAYIIGLQKC